MKLNKPKLAILITATAGVLFGALIKSDLVLNSGNRISNHCPVIDKYPRSQAPISWVMADRMRVPDGIPAGGLPRRGFIDEEIFGKMERDEITPAGLSSDEEFVRRIYLDLTGRIPSAQNVRDFLEDTSADKRDRLIDQLLASDAFTDKLTLWLGDLLENSAVGINNGGGGLNYTGRTQYYNFIREFAANATGSYAAFAKELIKAIGNNYELGPANFVAREWRGGEILQDMQDDLVDRVGAAFLGTQLLCINCHDGARFAPAHINLWLQERRRPELWGMSSFFSGVRFNRTRYFGPPQNEYFYDIQEVPTQGYDTNVNNGIRPSRRGVVQDRFITSRYIFTGEENPDWLNGSPRETLGNLVTADPLFAKALVNAIWADLMHLGIIDPPKAIDPARLDPDNPPPEGWDIQPSHPALLNRLADAFVESDYNLRSIISLITTSTTYQLSARYAGSWEDRFTRYFARRIVNRLSSETLHDSVAMATGVPGNYKIPQRNEERRNANCPDVTTVVQWAHQLPDTTEPGCNQDGGVRAFLNLFERGNRFGTDRKIPPAGSISQVLGLMNNNFVVSRVTNANGLLRRLIDDGLSDEELVDELFLGSLSRRPTDNERTIALSALSGNRQQGAEHLLLALVNMIDFLFN